MVHRTAPFFVNRNYVTRKHIPQPVSGPPSSGCLHQPLSSSSFTIPCTDCGISTTYSLLWISNQVRYLLFYLTYGEIKANIVALASDLSHLPYNRDHAAALPMASATMIASPLRAPDHFGRALKRYWGYDTFRPKQEEIVRNLSAGRDVCVVMPTGGGKSLCYQLPAVLQEDRTAVVISPLIALMQDQVAQLRQMGIPAVFLNSSVAESERSAIKKKALAGEFRLMYISPERAVMDGTADWLKRVPVSFFAIDEAHCISEWGHDFRPEYRQLSKLRELFPERPIAAFTASATQRVRHDIVEQLRLRDPFCAVLSFRRENLRYLVKFCQGDMQNELLLKAVKAASRGNVIVYAPTVARVGEVVDLLGEHGIAAVEYHGQMSSQARRENQEKWMSEEVRILVGTIAFGLGINKPNVRAVIRLGLPDSIEQLYQETGRAGRDGLPADCYLFWEWKDKRLREYFMSKIGSSRRVRSSTEAFRANRKLLPEARSAARNRFAPISEKNERGKVAAFVIAAPALQHGWKIPASLRKRKSPEQAEVPQRSRSFGRGSQSRSRNLRVARFRLGR